MTRYPSIPAPRYDVTTGQGTARLAGFTETMSTRRSIRQFSSRPVPTHLIEQAIAVAGSAPSDYNLQPWRFVVVADPDLKRAVRAGAEAEEGALAGKPYLETAPYLIVVFEILQREGARPHHGAESVGIAVGFLLAALHHAGLATLVHGPSPRTLNEILDRPAGERPYAIVPVGYPADNAVVPAIPKKPLSEILIHR
ncbi:MAG: nitroreductase family protein [Mycobacteriales bacterium]|jgi:iodotyrosine deiodinase